MFPSFLGFGVIAKIGEIMVEAAEEKGAETTAFAINIGERFKAEESRKKTLDGILGVGRR